MPSRVKRPLGATASPGAPRSTRARARSTLCCSWRSVMGGPGGASTLPLHKQVAAGAFAGICEVLTMYPLDLLKTRYQTSTVKNPSILQGFSNVVGQQGIVGLYRGILAPIAAEAPKRALKFSANEQYKALLRLPDGTLPLKRAFVAGMLAGMTEAFINCPFEVVKVQMQSVEMLNMFKRTPDALLYLAKNRGYSSLYVGLESMFWRNGVWNGVYFGVIPMVTRAVNSTSSKQQSHGAQLFTSFVSGTIAGTLATAVNSPFDVAKSRIQVQAAASGTARTYHWALPTLFSVFRKEGLDGIYKGLGLRLLRLGPGGGIMLVAFDVAQRLLA